MDATAQATARLFQRQPGSPRPHGGQIRAVWQWTAEIRRRRGKAPALEGAYRALEWAVGLSNTPPVTGQRFLHPQMLMDVAFTHANEHDILKPISQARLAAEINHAADQAQYATDPDKVSYAVGAHGLLSWWAGIADLPEQLVPDPRQLKPERQTAAA